MKKTILVIDDDAAIGDLLEELLSREGYGVLRAYSGTEAGYLLRESRPDLILLDLMLPGMSGEEVLPICGGVPVIVLSARSSAEDKIRLLSMGASDYVTKPFHTGELLARVAANLRKAASAAAGLLTAGGLKLDPFSHEAFFGGILLHLTRTEYAILRQLMQHPGQVVTRSALLDSISLDTPDCTESSLRQHMSNLRRKLRAAGCTQEIESVWGIGFRLES